MMDRQREQEKEREEDRQRERETDRQDRERQRFGDETANGWINRQKNRWRIKD